MKNNMEQPSIPEAKSSFLGDFMKQAWLRWREMEPQMKEHFKWNGAENHIRVGNFSDFVKAETQANIRAAEMVIEDMRAASHGGKEAFHHEGEALKFIAFLRAEAQKIALYAEARDDDNLRDLVEIMERRDPSLRAEYDKYKQEVSGNSQKTQLS